MADELKKGLYLIPTPIGNLGDITLRAIEVLREMDLLLAEDTRVTGKLLKHLDIRIPMESFHQNNEHRKLDHVVSNLNEGMKIGVCTDAGSPGISDPGFLLVRECVRENIPVISLPGATAFVPALTNSGLPCDRFIFEGFLPAKSGRKTRLEKIGANEITSVLYESPHRLIKTLEQICEWIDSERQLSVSREISKLHEETVRGSAAEVLEHFKNHPPKGEFVIVIAGTNEK